MSSIAPDIIFFHLGTHASTQSGGALYNAGWRRETAFDDRFPKSYGTDNPNVTGGSHTHSHVGSSHSHSPTDTHGHNVTYNTSSECASYGGSSNNDPIAQCGHGHSASTITTMTGGIATDTVAYPVSTNNSQPPHYTFIFVKATTGAVFQVGMIGLWDSSTIPANWRVCTDGANGAPALGNKYAKGALAGADGGETGGSFTHTHDLSHSHTTSHGHTGLSGTDDNHPTRANSGGSGGNKTNSHQHNVTLNNASVTTDTYSGSVTSGTVEPVFKKLLAIQRQAGGATSPLGIIGLWLGSTSSLPKGWQLCNGDIWPDGVHYTRDMRDKHLKFANSASEIGNTGGSNTHDHPTSNSHTHSQSGTHNHTGYTDSQGGSTASGGSTSPGAHTHTLASVGNNNATLTWGSASMSAESVNNEPAYLTAAFIQLTKNLDGGGMQMNMMG